MPGPIIECVPNFSEARHPDVVADILRAAQTIPGALVLDCHSDTDHNRTVVTMAGSPESMERAAFAAVACAAEKIDLRRHSGVHPRIGAADVVPFIPIRKADIDLCIFLARKLGRRIGEELGLPVYLYGEAAVRPERRSLAVIRKGQFEGLRAVIATDPSRRPDFGPARMGPAGATAVGARGPLLAFNIFLDTADAEPARQIARNIRSTSGGLPNLQALGFLVRGRAQVSMNLTNFSRTSLLDAYQAVQREADRIGVGIAHSEIIGLIPAAAIHGISPQEIRIEGFTPEKILERRLETLLRDSSAK